MVDGLDVGLKVGDWVVFSLAPIAPEAVGKYVATICTTSIICLALSFWAFPMEFPLYRFFSAKLFENL